MYWPIAMILACSLLVGCSRSGVIPIEDVEIVCVSGHADVMEVFFKLPEGVECEGIHVESSGNVRVLTFVREGNESNLEISSRAVIATEGSFAGSLLVKVPVPAEIKKLGGEFILKYAGDDTAKDTLKFLRDDS